MILNNDELLNTLKNLSDEQLFLILEAKTFADVAMASKKKALTQENLSLLKKFIKESPPKTKNASNNISESLLDALTPTSYIALILDAGFTLITSMAVAPFIVIGLSFLAVFIAVGGIHFMATYKERKEKDQAENERLQFLALRSECANIYLRRKNKAAFLKKVQEKNSEVKPEEKKWQNAKGVLGTTVLVTSALFYTYYAMTQGLVIALASSLVVSALAGPIGVGIALAVFIGVGIYFGYKKYQLHKKEQVLQHEREDMKNEFLEKYKKCQTIRNKTQPDLVREEVPINSFHKGDSSEKGSRPFLLFPIAGNTSNNRVTEESDEISLASSTDSSPKSRR